ncbi:MAG: thymidine kinase [Clostridia bacterium]|nr:thymidine kinase [Clostridia bacterium]
MKRLYFKYGVMGSSKSASALMTAFNYRQKGYNVLLAKPSIDTREGRDVISSRIGLSAECKVFSKSKNLINFVKENGGADVVIVDEAQFCTAKQIDELKELTLNDVVVICYGLKTNFKSELFEGSKRLLELAESVQEIKSVCRCGSKATMNARVVNGFVITEGKEIQIGGDEKYEAMCFACYKKYQKEQLPQTKNS